MQLAAAFQRAGVVVFPGSVLGDADHVRVSLKSPLATDRLLAVLPGIATSSAAQGWEANGAEVMSRPAAMAYGVLEGSAA